jgi:hypothetical protein
MSPAVRRFAVRAALVGACLFPSLAHADEAVAEQLVQEGVAAMKRSDFAVACEAFAGSNKADPSPGTQINLALCYEKQKKWASAWTWYRSAAGLAQQKGQTARVTTADESAARVKPLIHYVVVAVREPLTDLVVKRDGAEVVIAVAGKEVPLPIDPGEHTIEVTARGKKPWSKSITFADTPGTERVEVPKLENAPVEAQPPAQGPGAGAEYRPPVIVANDGSGQRTAGLIVGGSGLLAGLAAVGVFILAKNEESERDEQRAVAADVTKDPEPRSRANGSAESHGDAAKNNQLISLVLAGGAVVLVGVGALVYFTAPKAKEKSGRPNVLPLLGPSFAGVGLGGTF